VPHLDSSSAEFLLTKRKRLRRELLETKGLKEVRIAMLSGSTPNEVADFLELLLLADGFRPEFHHPDFGRYYEEAVLTPEALVAFRPDIVHVHTGYLNIRNFPPAGASSDQLGAAVAAEAQRLRDVWTAVDNNLGCQIIQNNFELPPVGVLGNLDGTNPGGRTRFVNALNAELAREASTRRKLLIQDSHALSARVGLDRWFDWNRWFSYKVPLTIDASLALAKSVASMVRAIYGKTRKCLVLDLDNTLWGGVIGDDGPEKIVIGRETARAEAYTAFQEYCLAMRERGVLLAVCSKNDAAIARQGFAHPDSVLKLEHFSAFHANWEPKSENIAAIARELNLGVDSFVFVDDNPAERALVAAQLPAVAVPDVGSEVAGFAAVIEAGRYFEPAALSTEDLQRAEQYRSNTERAAAQAAFANYGEYLDSLGMTAEIDGFKPHYLERITQLTNKTNQFNLTTRRYTLADIESMAKKPGWITLYGRLSDVFGDNGLISVIVGRKDDKDAEALHVDLWLMSCRVLKRDMELAMLDALVARARAVGVRYIHGTYIPTPKNGMVAEHYPNLGFAVAPAAATDGADHRRWVLPVDDYAPRNRHIKVRGAQDA
jgi:FkbH-like protein